MVGNIAAAREAHRYNPQLSVPRNIAMSARPSGRRPEELRAWRITRHYTRHAEGSVLVEAGDTKVLCTASVEEGVPPFLKGKGQGWVTA